MNNAKKLKQVDAILERAADQIGDITAAVMTEFHRADADTQALFTQHRPVDTERLEAGMVEQALYCFMTWFKSPGEIEMTLLGSVPHHAETLNVTVEHYHRLLQATATVIRQTIPPANREEIDVWNEIADNLERLIETARHYVYTPKAKRAPPSSG